MLLTHAAVETCPFGREVPLAKPSGDEDPPVLRADLKLSNAFLGDMPSFSVSDSDSHKMGPQRVGASAHQRRPVTPAPVEDSAPMGDESSPSTRSNSAKRSPDGLAEGAPPLRRARTDNQMEVDITYEDGASRGRFLLVPYV